MTQGNAKLPGAIIDRIYRLKKLVLILHVALALIGGFCAAIPWAYEFNDLRPNGRALFSPGFGMAGVLLFLLWPCIASYAAFNKRDEVAFAPYIVYVLSILFICLSSSAAIWYSISASGQILLAVPITTIQYMFCAFAARRLLRNEKTAS